MNEIVLLARDVSKAYRMRQVLRGVDLAVTPGQLVAVMGENGAGKSTLLKIVAGTLAADSGSARLTGTLGYCPQDPVVNDNLTVEAHLRYFAAAGRLPSLGRAEELVRQLGYAQHRREAAGTLSGGTRQKLNLTLALMHDPGVLLLDEPYQGFDWETYLQFWDLVGGPAERSAMPPCGATCYCVDEDFGPFFLKFCSYFPFNAKLCINGNEWAKRQAARAGIGFTPMDNAFAAVDDVAALQAICHALGPAQIDALLRKWLARLPHPFSPADRAGGYRYDISILQAEFSLTQMLDKPVSGRIFFEQVIRDNLDLGRPDRISLIFGRSIYRGRKNHTPGTFATRVVTDGVTPSLHVLYKHTQIKQYLKHGRALRTETTINQAMDFGLGKRLTNLPALREIGYTANRRLLAVQRLSHDPITGDSVLRSACNPVIHDNGTRVAGLRLTDPRAQALLHILLIFRLHPRGFLNKDLRALLSEYLGRPPRGPGSVTPGQATYDLRRLREHGLIERIPHTHRYQVTSTGLRHAMFLTRIHDRILRTGLAELTGPDPAPLRKAATIYQAAIDNLVQRAGIAA